MLIVISSAKKLDYKTPVPIEKYTIPEFLNHSKILVDILKNSSIEILTKLMNISYGLAELNLERYKKWSLPFTPENARQAIFAFKGDVYEAMQAYNLSEDELSFAQEHLRIISGLYGLLRPLDLIQPYRLPMGTKLKNPFGKDLYAFWSELITNALNNYIKLKNYSFLLNLASNEYFKAINVKKLSVPIINVVFKEHKNGVYRVISFKAKRARGMMCNFIFKNKISKIDDIKAFDYEGYKFSEEQSDKNKLVFLR